MIYSRIALATLVAAAGMAGSAQAAGLLPDLPSTVMVQDPGHTIVQAPSEHSSKVPLPGGSGDSSGGNPPGPISIKKTRNLPTPGGGTPGGESGGDHPLDDSIVMEHRDYALVCTITESGALRLANAGSETMPSGVKIKWKAGSQRGAFRLTIDLEPGASAAAPDMFEDDTANSCWAAVI